MKRPLLAVLLLASGSAAPRARADDGAYVSLVGMARSAASDRGPDADADGAPARGAREKEELKDAIASAPLPSAPSVRPAAGPRLWTALYSALMPSWRAVPSLTSGAEPAVSSATARASRAAAPAAPETASDVAAVKAGERRGLAELLSSSAAPADLK